MSRTIDVNCDLGEGFGPYSLVDDVGMLEHVSSANVACGFHAGDPSRMVEVVAAAAALGVAVGAHPGYPDRAGFGRRPMPLSAAEVEAALLYQLGAITGLARAYGVTVAHVAVHGALEEEAVRDPARAAAVAGAVRRFDPRLVVVTQPGELAEAARSMGLAVAIQFHADRGYDESGRLLSRSRPGAVITDPDIVVARVLRLLADGVVETAGGALLPLDASTICLHGDGEAAIALAAATRAGLEAAGITLEPLRRTPLTDGA